VAGVTHPHHLAAAVGVTDIGDHETPLWVDPDAAAARRWIEFHCGAPDCSNAGILCLRVRYDVA